MQNKKMYVKIINKGTPFNRFYTFLGYLSLLGAFYFIYLSKKGYTIIEESNFVLYILLTIFFSLFAILLSFTTNKIKVDNAKNSIFTYTQVLFLKLGETKNLEQYKFSSILSKNMRMSSNIVSGKIPLSDARTRWNIGHESSVKFIKYEVILLNYNHRGKLLLNRFDTFEEAKEFAEMISKFTQKPLIKYNPKRISKIQ